MFRRLCVVAQSPITIVAVAFCGRLVGIAYFTGRFPGSKQATLTLTGSLEIGYVASSIARGLGFSSPFPGVPTGPTAWLTPVYPYLVAANVKLFGIGADASVIALLIENCMFSALTCLAVFYIARRIFGTTVAVSSGWCWSLLYYFALLFVGIILETTLVTFLFSLIFLLALHLPDSMRLGLWIGFGLLWGVTALTNPTLLSILPFMCGWLWYELRRRKQPQVRLLVISMLAFLLTVSPWLVRNYLTFRQFVPFRSSFGVELYLGNNPIAIHGREFARDQHLHPYLSESQRDRIRQIGELAYTAEKRSQAIEFIAQHPTLFLKLVLKRAVYWWTGVWWGAPTPWFKGSGLLAALRLSHYMALGVFAWIGLGMAIQQRQQVFPFLILLAIFPLPFYVIHADPRYRHPMEPEMIILATYAVVKAFSRLGKAFLRANEIRQEAR